MTSSEERELSQPGKPAGRRTFVPSEEFVQLGRGLTTGDSDKLRIDIDSMAAQCESTLPRPVDDD